MSGSRSVMGSQQTIAADAANVWYWANAYKVSMALFALAELHVLERLSAARRPAAALAKELNLATPALEPVLRLLTDLDICDLNDEGYALSPAAVKLLPLLLHESVMSHKYVRHDALVGVLRGGHGVVPTPEADPQELAIFMDAMGVKPRTLAPLLMRFAKLGPQTRLLDLGGADGALALSLRRFLPDLRATVVDLPRAERAFEDRLAAAGADRSRFRFVAGDLRWPADLAGELADHDVVVMSNVLHFLSAEERWQLLEAVRRSTPIGGRVIVYDQFVAPDKTLDAAYFMVIDWVVFGYHFDMTEEECAAELAELGLVAVKCHRTPLLPGAIVIGSVPERASEENASWEFLFSNKT